jgi:hypothetical protein
MDTFAAKDTIKSISTPPEESMRERGGGNRLDLLDVVRVALS